jgi:hypothetical protein
VADEERQALAARLRAGPPMTYLEQLALGLFPATLGSRPVGVLVREIAAGMPVPVQIDATAGRLNISVGDDGCGGASLANSRWLRGLADRIEVVGGILSVVSPPGGPTQISAEIRTP